MAKKNKKSNNPYHFEPHKKVNMSISTNTTATTDTSIASTDNNSALSADDQAALDSLDLTIQDTIATTTEATIATHNAVTDAVDTTNTDAIAVAATDTKVTVGQSDTNITSVADPITVVDAITSDTALPDLSLGQGIAPDEPLTDTRVERALANLRGDILSDDTAAAAQVALYNAFNRYLVRKSDSEFKVFLNNLLTYIHGRSNHEFHKTKCFRGFHKLKGLTGEQEREAHILLGILVDTANPETRYATAKAINWETVRNQLAPTFSGAIITRLKSFYNVK